MQKQDLRTTTKKKKNPREKKQTLESDPQGTHMLKLADKDFKIIMINTLKKRVGKCVSNR